MEGRVKEIFNEGRKSQLKPETDMYIKMLLSGTDGLDKALSFLLRHIFFSCNGCLVKSNTHMKNS